MEAKRVVRVVEREWVVWRRLWRGSVFSYVFAPLLFLAAMGIGLGDLVDKHQGGVQGFDYLQFITPGLMAASAVMQAAGESLWPVMGGVKWLGTYHAAVSTPVAWDEVEHALGAEDPGLLRFESEDVLARVEERGDLFAPVLTLQQALPSFE